MLSLMASPIFSMARKIRFPKPVLGIASLLLSWVFFSITTLSLLFALSSPVVVSADDQRPQELSHCANPEPADCDSSPSETNSEFEVESEDTGVTPHFISHPIPNPASKKVYPDSQLLVPQWDPSGIHRPPESTHRSC